MPRFTRWLLMVGAVVCPCPVFAQYYYSPAPAYYSSPPRPTYYSPPYPYGYQGGSASYYPQPYSQGQWSQPAYSYPTPSYSYSSPSYSYPSPSYSYPNRSYSQPSTSYYPTARPMPSAPPNYYPISPAMPPLATKTPIPPASSAPPVLSESVGDSDTIKPSHPEPVYHKGKNPPEVINIQPPALTSEPSLPSTCASCKAGVTMAEAHPDGAACANCQKDKKAAKFMAFGEGLYWNVRGSNLPFAQAFDGVDPLAVPRGPVGMAMPGFATGIRAGAGIALSDHSWFVLTGTYYDNTTTTEVSATGTNILHSFLVFPTTINSAFDSLIAHATYGTRLESVDMDYKFAFLDTEQLQLSFLGGARYAHLEQSLASDFQILGTTTVNSRIAFDGVGIRLGVEGEYRIKGGFYGYGKGILDVLGGHFAANYEQRNVFAGLQAQTQFGEDRLVPVFELELGVGWVSPKGHIRASTGYYVGSWFNTLTMPSLVQGIQNTNFTTNGDNFRDTLTFDGFVGKLEFRF